jgi:hypothetical protein
MKMTLKDEDDANLCRVEVNSWGESSPLPRKEVIQ